jgi:hypothetical protein
VDAQFVQAQGLAGRTLGALETLAQIVDSKVLAEQPSEVDQANVVPARDTCGVVGLEEDLERGEVEISPRRASRRSIGNVGR